MRISSWSDLVAFMSKGAFNMSLERSMNSIPTTGGEYI